MNLKRYWNIIFDKLILFPENNLGKIYDVQKDLSIFLGCVGIKI